jgi:hypothetical protein
MGRRPALDGFFGAGGTRLAYPADPDGPPGKIARCRCTMLFVELTGR